MDGYEHACQRSDDAEAAYRNLMLFGGFSGNRPRTYPLHVRVKALRLLGQRAAAQGLLDEAARNQPVGQVVDIPHQRRPHPSEMRLANRVREAQREADQNRSAAQNINNRGGRQ